MSSATAPRMVLVVWEDASQMDSSTWVENKGEHAYEPHMHHQVGFLLSSTKKGVVLTSTWSPELVSARDSIPRGMVKSIQYLEPKRPATRRKTERATTMMNSEPKKA